MNLGGGTHHAGRDFARGYCLFNDVAVALAALRRDGLARPRARRRLRRAPGRRDRADLRRRPARRSRSRCTARATTRSSAIPSDLDVDIATGTGDDRYLRALGEALDFALDARRPDFAFYLAGADPWEGDRLGRLALTKRGLRGARRARARPPAGGGRAVCVVLAGGYAEDVRDTVDINAGTAAAVAERCRALTSGRSFATGLQTGAKAFTLVDIRGFERFRARRVQAGPPGPRRTTVGPRTAATPPFPRRRRHDAPAPGWRHYSWIRQPGGVVLTGTRRPCMPELGVRFPSPPLRHLDVVEAPAGANTPSSFAAPRATVREVTRHARAYRPAHLTGASRNRCEAWMSGLAATPFAIGAALVASAGSRQVLRRGPKLIALRARHVPRRDGRRLACGGRPSRPRRRAVDGVGRR